MRTGVEGGGVGQTPPQKKSCRRKPGWRSRFFGGPGVGRLFCELNAAPWRFVRSRRVCIFGGGRGCVVCVLQQQQQQIQQGPNERCLNTDTSWAVLSGSFKRVTGIYLVTERVTGCFS